MISDPFYISKNGTLIPINLGVGVDPFNRKVPIYSKAWYAGVVGVKWKYGSEEVTFISDCAASIDAYPTPCMNNMIVIMYGSTAAAKESAICLNAQAEIIFKLNLPIRLSGKDKHLPKGELGFLRGVAGANMRISCFFTFRLGIRILLRLDFLTVKQWSGIICDTKLGGFNCAAF